MSLCAVSVALKSNLAARYPATAFSTTLFNQFDAIHHHAAINGFEHVVDGEQSDARGGQGFHFYAGTADRFCI